MFTGLIQALGSIKSLEGDYWQITCVGGSTASIMEDIALGDSVAVDGICLSVEKIIKDGFIATASPETLSRTTLGKAQNQEIYVNLETSLRVGSKVGGHFVMGHVDGTGELVDASRTATSWEMTFTATDAIARYIVPKGSIAVNGISLTVAEYQSDSKQFQVAVIPITYAETNLRYLNPGSKVNLEADILGKYVEKFIAYGKKDLDNQSNNHDISPAFLSENGYI
ncbi:MAG: riboflavin synthase [Cyanobacteria bacterium P01_A01_bin.45]